MRKITHYKFQIIVIILIILISLLFQNAEINSIIAQTNNKTIESEISFSSLTPHLEFTITNDNNFTDYSLPGSGTSDEPYIIENYNITTTNANGIYITGTTKYFEIRNCYITASETGIYVTNVAINTTRIENNTIENCNLYAMRVTFSSESTILNNNLNDNYNGIYMSSGTGGTLFNNTIINSRRGMWLSSLQSISLINNTCITNIWGIDLSLCHNSIIINNTLISCNSGIWQVESDNTIIENNTCTLSTNNAIIISNSDDVTVSFNKVLNNNHGIYFSDYSERARIFNNTISYNTGISALLLKGAIFENNTVLNNGDGISITEENCTIKHNIFINNTDGNSIYNGEELTIQNNNFLHDGLEIVNVNVIQFLTCNIADNWVNGKELGFFVNLNNFVFDNPNYGQLILINCSTIEMVNQELYDTSTGIQIFYSDHINVHDSSCYYNHIKGIKIDSSNFVQLYNNQVFNNTDTGIYVDNSTETAILNNILSFNLNGIFIEESPSSLILNNTCEKNQQYGIYLFGSGFEGSPKYNLDIKKTPSNACLIVYNRLIENTGYGMYIQTDNNIIYNNTFIDNNLYGTSQAYDSGVGNTWYDVTTNLGNYWSDYVGTGSYSIDGSSGSFDLYPLAEIPPIPTVNEYTHQNTLFLLTIILFYIIGFLVFRKKRI